MSSRFRPRVLVLYGGQSSEHSVSCVTAAGVLRAIDTEKYDIVEIGITDSGQWTRPVVDPRTYSFDGGDLPRVESADSSVLLRPGVRGSAERGASLLEVKSDGSTRDLGRVDVVMPLLHGPYGEDGTLQGQLELAGVPYVGAGVLASAVGMDKHYMKLAFEAAGLLVSPWVTITGRQWRTDPYGCVERVKRLGLPVFVKPARAGSSLGVTKVDEWHQLEEAIKSAQTHDVKVLIEEGIGGREIECGVLGGTVESEPRASVCGEIVVHGGTEPHQFYDFEAKYTDDAATDLSCPADLPDEVAEEIRRQAVVAFEALDGEGLSRVDFFYDPNAPTGKQIVINEVNTMPGFTPISMYPQMWQATGFTYSELITELIELALQRPLGLR